MRRYTLLNRIIPRVMAVLLVLTLLMPLAPAAAAAEQSGTCGEDLKWSFTDGTLTITGKGAMIDYTEAEPAPWYSFREQILRLVLPEGLTRIGRMAFHGCERLTAVEIPDGVVEIRAMAFGQCEAMTMLRLPEGLTAIGRSAFEGCTKLADLRLPASLTRIDRRAFYRCEELKYVTVPERVVSMEDSVFAYCSSLIRAEILAPLTELPGWTFFGCENLSSIYLAGETKTVGDYAVYECQQLEVVYYGGTPGDAEELEKQINESREKDTDPVGNVSREEAGNSESTTELTRDENGDLVAENTTVTQTEDSTISVGTTTTNITDEYAPEVPAEIVATIITNKGWEELLAAIENAKNKEGVNATVHVSGNTELPGELLDALVGEKVKLTIVGMNGEEYALDFGSMESGSFGKGLNLSYSLAPAEKIKFEELEGVMVYELAFAESSEVPAALVIQLPVENARQTASLYQVVRGKLELVQSSVVDPLGRAHFYLSAVDRKTTYLIGINVPWVSGTDPIIPDSLESDYGVDYQTENMKYVITGRKSSWGIGFLEVNQIMVGFMLSTAAFVGLLMYALNKRKIRKGFVPGWDDADDGEE